MTQISSDEIRHLSLLCRVAMSDDDVEVMREQMSNILNNISILNRVDTEGIEPTGHSVDLVSVMRDDEVQPSTDIEDILANAPTREGEFIRVRAVLE